MQVSAYDGVSAVLAKVGLSFIPPKTGIVALTFHNIERNNFDWLREVVDLIGENYEFLSEDEIGSSGVGNGQKTGVLLTFDDGFRSNLYVAQDILGKHKIPAIFFITHGFVGLRKQAAHDFAQSCLYPDSDIGSARGDDRDAMDWEEITWLQTQGYCIGAHTETHPQVSRLTTEDKRREIIGAADKIEDKLGLPVRYFAYPFGTINAVDDESFELAATRFDFSFSNIRGMINESPSRHFLYRQNIVPGMPLWLVEAIIEGRLDWRYRNIRRLANIQFSDVPS